MKEREEEETEKKEREKHTKARNHGILSLSDGGSVGGEVLKGRHECLYRLVGGGCLLWNA